MKQKCNLHSHNPICPLCHSDIEHVGNEDYGENGNKYLSIALIVAQRLKSMSLWMRTKSNSPFGKEHKMPRLYPINTDKGMFHCPICNHYHKCSLSDIIPGLKRRCNREPAVIVEL